MEQQLIMFGLGVSVAGLGWYVKRMQKQIDDANREVQSIKLNYLDRFADLRQTMTEGHERIMEKLNGLSVDMAKNYVTKDDCPQLHK